MLTDRYFAPDPVFQWYSEYPMRRGATSGQNDPYDRSTLDAYLQRRHAEGDHLTLVSLHVSGINQMYVDDRRHSLGNFSFVASRNGTSLPSKAALDCESHLFVAWSVGPNPGP